LFGVRFGESGQERGFSGVIASVEDGYFLHVLLLAFEYRKISQASIDFQNLCGITLIIDAEAKRQIRWDQSCGSPVFPP
jgi:hypothetical protein